MLPFAYYLLKIIICSAVLFAYYWFFLRNKVFHAYNRFFLLSIIVLSLSLPLLRIPVLQPQAASKTNVIRILQAVNAGDEYMNDVIISSKKSAAISFTELVTVFYMAISLVFFIMLLNMLITIFRLLRNYNSVESEGIHFVNTDNEKGTPFSFFKYIFWNKRIDVQSPSGNRIFRHEVAHIQEKHSFDKMFINLVLTVFWSNPVFWLIRRELNMIHEFIADKRAVEDGDTAAFAAMILEATYPQQRMPITNNFFYSPIKRRLMMLTKNQNPKINYISRLLVLPLAGAVFAAFSLKTVKSMEKKISKSESIANSYADNQAILLIDQHSVNSLLNDTLYYKGKAIIKMSGKPNQNFVTLTYADKTTEQLTIEKARNAHLYPPPPPTPTPLGNVYSRKNTYYIEPVLPADYKGKAVLSITKTREGLTLVYADGSKEKITEENAVGTGIEKFILGEMMISQDSSHLIPMAPPSPPVPDRRPAIAAPPPPPPPPYMVFDAEQTIPANSKNKERQIISKGGNLIAVHDFVVIDQKVSSKEALDKISPEDISEINILKKERSIEKYGQAAAQGAIEVKTKSYLKQNPEKDPTFSIGDLTKPRLPAEEFKKQTELRVSDGYEFSSATLYFSGANFPKVGVAFVSGSSLNSAKELIEKCVPGSAITFVNVKVKGQRGLMTIEEKSFLLY